MNQDMKYFIGGALVGGLLCNFIPSIPEHMEILRSQDELKMRGLRYAWALYLVGFAVILAIISEDKK